ncbi:MAG: AI-2E family transporter [Saprospiraceae bacterium]|nr:AI-2E family transporter [Saprospiraceae bacterium]
MIDKAIKLPSYAKLTISLIGIFALLTMIYIAQGIILPLVFAFLVAIILQPLVSLFVKWKINRLIAIFLTMLITVLIIFGISALLYSRLSQFSESWPILVERFTVILSDITSWISHTLNLNQWKFHKWIRVNKTDLINNSGAEIGHTLAILGSGVVVLFIIPIYVIMILFYEPLLLEFIRRLFAEIHQPKVSKIVSEIKKLIQRYLVGLVIEFGMVAILYSSVLLILGVDYAILLGVIGALFNVIPYLGGFIAAALSMMVAIATKSTAWYAIYVLIGYYIVHLIDYNFIVPKIVASKVKVNALVSVFVIISAAALLGIPGMIICIPVTGIIKLIFDHIEPLKPWGFLLGDTMPSILKINPIHLKLKKNKIK